MKRTIVALVMFLCIAGAAHAQNKVLILDTTVFGGLNSIEAQAATALGFTVDLVSPTVWGMMTATDFDDYRAIILGDAGCQGLSVASAAEANADIWGSVINGNVIIVGTDPFVHASVGGRALSDRAVAYATAKPGKRGAYISLSCYYDFAAPNTPVPLLDKAFGSGPGSFEVRSVNCFNDAHITATDPALVGPLPPPLHTVPALSDALLSNWGCSVHEAFDKWPLSFAVLAIAENSGNSYTAPDATVGSPYILARGEDLQVLSDITLSPKTADNEVGELHVVTATLTPPLPGIVVTFTVVSGPNLGLTATAVTDASGKASFSYASTTPGVDFIQAQFVKDGKTQTSNIAQKRWVQTPKSCLRVLQSEVTCEVGKNGKPTGSYVWKFRFQNLSGKPISHLFLFDLPSPAVATPTHVAFTTPVTNVSPLLTVTIKNVGPGPVTFVLSGHDLLLDECCSMPVTLDLPSCDCAQIVSEVRPSCFWPLLPPPYKYSFTLQNLSPLAAANILIAAVSPSDHVTPIPTSQLNVTKDVFTIPPLNQGGMVGPLTVSVSGPGAVPGSEVCLRIGLHERNLDNCCSIVRCFRLPNCIFNPTDKVSPVGSATLTPIGTGFRIGGIGSSGNDGVALTLDDALAAGFSWQRLDAEQDLPDGAFVELRAVGRPTEATGRLRVTQNQGTYRIETNIDGARSYKVEVFDQGRLVGSASQSQGVNIVVVWPTGAGVEIAELPGGNHPETLAFVLDSEEPVPWRLANGTTLVGDRFRISSEQPADHLSLQTLELRAANIPSILLTGASVTHDCNGNGVPDAEDIAHGTSLDLDQNGIPDECQPASAGNLELELNTGFDQESGTALPRGTADPEWQITNATPPRAANVVTNLHPVWPQPLAGSAWISLSANQGQSVPGLPTMAFENCFCIASGATTAQLEARLLADDIARVFLNDVAVGGPGGRFSETPLTIDVNGAVGPGGPFRIGRNCLRVEVTDTFGGVVGLDLVGTVHAANGLCGTTTP